MTETDFQESIYWIPNQDSASSRNMSATPNNSDSEFVILKRVSDGPLPVHTRDATVVAPIERWAEIINAGLVNGRAIKGDSGDVVKLIVTGLHYTGRQRLTAITEIRRSRRPMSIAKKWLACILWTVLGAVLGIGATLLTQWLSKMLGLSN